MAGPPSARGGNWKWVGGRLCTDVSDATRNGRSGWELEQTSEAVTQWELDATARADGRHGDSDARSGRGCQFERRGQPCEVRDATVASERTSNKPSTMLCSRRPVRAKGGKRPQRTHGGGENAGLGHAYRGLAIGGGRRGRAPPSHKPSTERVVH
ncbi:hypothetical protein TRAPUB_8255 [Trametes pubescens]|uniref:Uncharacterized protein n=1 Tax=Trametes pubescens TaxID=154538 RepID=A0A1M2W5L6_TRAPU|nr:hypothetical protein TRAPUB_8255 [Trametes pubescens]